ncbi:ABC transporter substrate-binding protein [Kineosporiaceae bacterium SCSIO 59966]|nr:ABC transporter substrate-binding protein [Kineosporiaceae bacterium SCSIO 59966]
MTRRPTVALVACLTAVSLAACGGSGFEEEPTVDSTGGGDAADADTASLRMLIGSSGPAETEAVTAAAAAFAEDSGHQVEVVAATDLAQELSQGFAAGDPPDVFYVGSDQLAGYADNGSLLPYAADLENASDFYPNLVDAFTYEGQFYCAPKDFSTLGLIINTEAWEAAGLTEDDVPTTWEELRTVAATLTTGDQVGLVTSSEYQRLGAFMEQAGGGLVTEGEATADSPENLEALTFVKDMLAEGSMAFTGEVGAGWGGEAFGTGRAAMTIEGNWIAGAMNNDYPDVDYLVAPLPEGPAGAGTLSFTNCWGIAADSESPEAAADLVAFLTQPEQQMEFARAFGVMPSVQSAEEAFRDEFPQFEAFIEQADVATTPPNAAGVSDVIADLNAQLESLESADPAAILSSTQANLEAVLGAQ